MRLIVNLDKFFHRHVSVDLRRGKASVAEQFLDVTQVGAAVEQMRRKGMSQSVRADVVHARTDGNVFLNHPANRTRGYARALIV